MRRERMDSMEPPNQIHGYCVFHFDVAMRNDGRFGILITAEKADGTGFDRFIYPEVVDTPEEAIALGERLGENMRANTGWDLIPKTIGGIRGRG